MDGDDNIRIPDQSFSDRLIYDDEDENESFNFRINNEDYVDPYDMEKAIEVSMNDYAVSQVNEHIIYEKIQRENLEKEKEYRKNILKQFNIRLNYFKNDSNYHTKEMSIFLENELSKYMECSIDNIYLFKKHYELLDYLIENLYDIPLSKNLKTRISSESYTLLKKICKYL